MPNLCGASAGVWGCRVNHDWMADALCRDYPADLFYPEGQGPIRKQKELEAQAVCDRCPVKQKCGEWADKIGEPHGVWGGTLREGEPRKAIAFRAPHGTPGAAKRHHRDKEALCALCRESERIRNEARREMRRRTA